MSTPALNPLVEKIRGKYPGAYDDMDDAALTKAILAKYPQYSDLAAPPMAKPSVKMDTGEGPIAAGMTSFETQLSKVPAATGQFLKSAAQGFPEDTAAHNRVLAGQADPVDELKNALQKLNPIVSNSEGIDYGATAANLLPVLLGLKKGSISEAASTIKSGAGSVLEHPVTKAIAKTADVASFERFSKAYQVWKNLPAEIRAKTTPPTYPGAPLPEAPPAEVLQASSLARGPQPVVDPAQGLGSIPGTAGSLAKSVAQLPEAFNRPVPPVRGPVGSVDNPFQGPPEGPRQAPPLPDAFQPRGPQYKPPVGTVDNPHISQGAIQQAVEELGPKTPVPAIRTRAVEIQQQLNKALGAQELKPNVPLRDQLSAKAPEAPKLPEGFTPVDSSALKGFKYDPATKEFETITQGGQRYIHGDVSPEAVQSFMDAESKGKAWQGIRNDGTLVAKVVNGKRVAVKPTSAASAGPESSDLASQLQQSVENVKAQKASGAPRFVYRARDIGEAGVPLNNDAAQATSDPLQAMKYAEAGQRGAQAGEVVKIDLSKLKPSDYVVKTHPGGAKWIQFTRPLTEDEISVFAGKTAGKK